MRECLSAGSSLTGKKRSVRGQPGDGLGVAGHSEASCVLWKAGRLLPHTGAQPQCVGPAGQRGAAAAAAGAPLWQRAPAPKTVVLSLFVHTHLLSSPRPPWGSLTTPTGGGRTRHPLNTRRAKLVLRAYGIGYVWVCATHPG